MASDEWKSKRFSTAGEANRAQVSWQRVCGADSKGGLMVLVREEFDAPAFGGQCPPYSLEWQTGQEYDVLAARMAACPAEEFAVSIVSFDEQTLGAHNYISRARTRENFIKGYGLFETVRSIFCSSQVLPMDDAASEILNHLRSMRLHVKVMDLRIAAIAIANHVTVLTRNTVDFSRNPGVSFEDWSI